METIAVYWEEKVQVYGITEKSNFCLGKLCFPPEHARQWGNHISHLQESGKRFEFVTMHTTESGALYLLFLFGLTERKTLLQQMDNVLAADSTAHFTTEFPVDIIYLHGPHFQDRFGIAESAFTALQKNSETILASGCAGTSMYIITPGGRGTQVGLILSDTFSTPTSC